MMQVEAAEEAVEEEVGAAEGQPAPLVAPWLSLPQGQRWDGGAVFHERSAIP